MAGTSSPGEVRRSQNWIGGSRPGNARFVPPPPEDVPCALGAMEEWLYADSDLSPLLRIALAHVQFETIHPFLDGNGRIGRLLIALLAEHWNLLEQPLLYVSVAFRLAQQEYYARLSAVRDRHRIIAHDRPTVAAIQLLEQLPSNPVVTVPGASVLLGLTAPPTRKAIQLLEGLDILREITGKRRGRLYVYNEYLQILTGDDA